MSESGYTPAELADRLDDILAPVSPDAPGQALPNDEADPRVNAALRLANASPPVMPPEAMQRVGQQVLAAAQQQQRQRASYRRRAYVVGRTAAAIAVLLLMLGGGLLPVTAASLPGDALYPLKLGLEQVGAVFAPSAEAQAEYYLELAARRVEEAQTLLARGIFDQRPFDLTLAHLEQAASAARQSGQPAVMRAVQVGSVQVNMDFETALTAASAVARERVLQALPALQATRDGGGLLLPTTTPEPEPTRTMQPATAVPPAEAVPFATATQGLTVTLSVTPDAFAPDSGAPVQTHAPQDTLDPTPYRVYVQAATRVNLRLGPGLAFDILTALPVGTSLDVIGLDAGGEWLQVRLQNGTTGWIAQNLVSPELSTQLPPADEAAPTATSTMIATPRQEPVRTGMPDDLGNGESPQPPAQQQTGQNSGQQGGQDSSQGTGQAGQQQGGSPNSSSAGDGVQRQPPQDAGSNGGGRTE